MFSKWVKVDMEGYTCSLYVFYFFALSPTYHPDHCFSICIFVSRPLVAVFESAYIIFDQINARDETSYTSIINLTYVQEISHETLGDRLFFVSPQCASSSSHIILTWQKLIGLC